MSLVQLTTSQYETINQTLTQMLQSGAYTAVTVTLYNDAAGQHLAADNEGFIKDRVVSSITHTEPHNDEHGHAVNGSITLHFGDGSVIVCTDGINEYYYQVGGIAYVPRTYGQPMH
jgi:hypothetical protein